MSCINKNPPGMLVVISGPAGVGKGTVIQELLRMMPSLKLSVSVTTRLPRAGEIQGETYYFTDQMSFTEKIGKGYFLEWAEVHGEYYGTPQEKVAKEVASGTHLLLEIDVQGALQVKNNFADAVLIFMVPPSLNELRHRIFNRATEDADQIEKRLQTAQRELQLFTEYHYVVVNHEIEDTARKIEAVIRAELCRVHRFTDFFNNILGGER